MAVSLVGVGTFITGTTTPRTFTLPSGVQAGDLIVVVFGIGEDSPEPTVNSVASGYAIRGNRIFVDYGPGALAMCTYWKFAGASETSPAFGVTDADQGFWGYSMVWRGVDQTEPFDLAAVSQGNSTGASTTYTPESVETQTDGSMIVSIVQTSDNNTLALNTAQGFTPSAVYGSAYSTTDGIDASFGMAYKIQSSVGTVTLPTWEQTALGADWWAFQTLALRDASHPATVPGSFTANAVIKKAQSGSFTASAVIKRTIPDDFTADAEIVIPSTTITIGNYADVILADTPVAYWRLGEPSGVTADNAEGTAALDGTYVGTPVLGTDGLVVGSDTAMGMDATGEYVSVAHDAALDLTTNFSLEAWVVFANADTHVISKGDSGWEFFRRSSDGTLRFGREGVSNEVNAATTYVPLDTPLYVVATYGSGSGTGKIYVNGVDRTTAGTGSTFSPNSGTLYIGADYVPSYTFGAGGVIDEVAVYDYVLSAAEVRAHYVSGTTPLLLDAVIAATLAGSFTLDAVIKRTWGGGGTYAALVLSHEPTGYWRLGEASGYPQDSSGNGYNATGGLGTPDYGQAGAIVGDDDTAIYYGANEYHTVPYTAFQLGDVFTVEAWVKRGDLNTQSFYYWFGNRGSSGEGWFIGFASTGYILFFVYYNGGASSQTIFQSFETFEDTDLHHLVLTKDGATTNIYADGVELTWDGGTDYTLPSNYTKDWGIGAPGPGGYSLMGTLDELAVYASPLLQPQVETHYSVGAGLSAAFTLDAVVVAGATTVPGSFTANAVIAATQIGSLTADAVILRANSGAVAADAVLSSTQSGSFSASAVISRTWGGPAYRQTVLADGPVAYWRLGEPSGTTADNAEGTAALDGTYVGTPTLGVTGALTGDADTAVDFQQTGWVSIPNDAALAVFDSDFSVEFWAKPENAGSYQTHFAVTGASGLSITINVSAQRWIVYKGGSIHLYGPASDAGWGVWRHYAFTKASGDSYGKLYINGVDVSTSPTTAGPFANSDGALFISAYSGDNEHCDEIDEVAVYDYVLATAQVDAHYATGTGISASFSLNAVIAAGSATVPGDFTASAVIAATSTETFTGDAVVRRTESYAVTADAVLLREGHAASLTTDAIVRRTQAGSFTASAVIAATSSGSWTADAIVRKSSEFAATLDAVVQESQSGFFSVDAVVRSSASSSALADAVIRATAASAASSDAIISSTAASTFSSDAIVRKTSSLAFVIDALARKSFTSAFSLNAIVRRTQDQSFAANAWIEREQTGSFTADAALFKLLVFTADAITSVEQSAAFTADAWIPGTNIYGIGSYAVIWREQTDELTADAVARVAATGTMTLDAVFRASAAESLTTDAIIARAGSGSLTGDAAVRATASAAFVADAVIRRPETGTLTASAIVARTASSSLAGDAIALRGRTGSLTADAWVQGSGISAFVADAVITRTGSGAFTADAVSTATLAGDFTASALSMRTVAGTFVFDAVLTSTEAGSLTGDAVVRHAADSSFAANAVIRQLRVGSLTTDAIVLLAGSFAAIADAVFFAEISGSITAQAWLSGTFTADAVLEKENTGSLSADAVVMPVFPADAILRRSQEGQFTADAWIPGIGTSAFVADSIFRAVIGQEFTANSVTRVEGSGTITASSAILAGTDQAFTADAVAQKSSSSDLTVDAVVVAGRTVGFGADAVLLFPETGSATADAVLLVSQGGAATADATLRASYVDEFTADALALVPRSGSATADAYLFSASAGAFTGDAVIFREQLAQFLGEALVQQVVQGDLGADATILASHSDFLRADGALQATLERTFKSDAITLDSASNSVNSFAVIQRNIQGSISADAEIRGRKAFTADAVIIGGTEFWFSGQAIIVWPTAPFEATLQLQIIEASLSVECIEATISSDFIEATISPLAWWWRQGSFTAEAVLEI